MTPAPIDCFSSTKKRKNDELVEEDTSATKRATGNAQPIQTDQQEQPEFVEPCFMPPNLSSIPPRSTTPPLGMTLAHYNANSGGYSTSVVKSANEFSSPVCSGMTGVYRSTSERWGSTIL
ncbi:hypothetical protein BJV82DRAFT_666032 [Fennellomyces sp. T-0311]|nr:hypothetical protein BJV82DRAFT_666032 [Fennellomyces sp. T-0311]